MLFEAEVKIGGKTPMLMHAHPAETIPNLSKKPPQEQAEHAAYRCPEGYLCVPGSNLQRALVAGAIYSKGKGRASLQKPAAACLIVTPEFVRITPESKEYAIDARSVVMPTTKGRVTRYRPRINEWELTFTVEYDDELISESELKTIIEDTGLRVGLLDFRPACKGSFGRFELKSFKNLTKAKTKAKKKAKAS